MSLLLRVREPRQDIDRPGPAPLGLRTTGILGGPGPCPPRRFLRNVRARPPGIKSQTCEAMQVVRADPAGAEGARHWVPAPGQRHPSGVRGYFFVSSSCPGPTRRRLFPAAMGSQSGRAWETTDPSIKKGRNPHRNTHPRPWGVDWARQRPQGPRPIVFLPRLRHALKLRRRRSAAMSWDDGG